MALTQFQKDALSQIYSEKQRKSRVGKASEADTADMVTIVQGTEAERVAVIAAWSDDAIDRCTAEIAGCDTTKTALQARLAELQAYVA